LRTKTKPTKKAVRESFAYMNIASGYIGYERDKAALQARNLPPDQHEREMRAIIERWKI